MKETLESYFRMHHDLFRKKDHVLAYFDQKKIVSVFIPIAIILMVTHYYFGSEQLDNYHPLAPKIVYSLQLGFALSALTIFGSMNPIYTLKREFGYYLAKEIFRIARKLPTTTEQTEFLIKGLDSYNNFLKRNLGLQIKKMDELFSRVVSDSSLYNYIALVNNGINDDNAKLKLTVCLREMLDPKKNKRNEAEDTELLVRQTLIDRISAWSAFIIPIITVSVSIIQLTRN